MNLALFGGPKQREQSFPKHPIIGEEEKKAVLDVLESGNLSTFLAGPGKNFLGGKKIREFEDNFADYVGTKYAISFNSASSALHGAVVAIGVKPGEEVIVPPYTFTSTATSVLMHNAIPVFADVQNDIFCIDPSSVENRISSLTRAVIPVHLFGHPAEMDRIVKVAEENGLKIIEDCAQASGATYKGKNVGIMGDCGIFSFQETKNIATGEGGMLVTNDEEIAQTAQMVRNHGETILESQKERTYKTEFLGWGYRMTELEAALGVEQLRKLEQGNKIRRNLADFVTKKINQIDGIKHIKKDYVEHSYYVYAFTFDESKIGISRDQFVKALNAEGIPFYEGYVKPLYLNQIYHDAKPFIYKFYKGKASYEKGICPVTERLYEKELVMTEILRPPITEKDADDVVSAIQKVIENKQEFENKKI
ncbi:MAG: putative L-glutamine3-amino-23-dideoxy-scyllo-inosose aminotransferase protein [Nitrosopumilales archaeon]|nr:MAG: putative L-glutamine3-amino-23-dideoxy-scyllo-inosose aminotransferase protein [Nitrosopumilales archaeon]